MIGPQVERQQLLRRIRCHDCFEKQRELDKLKEEVERLRSEVNKLKRGKNKLKEEGPFGSSTPSSKKPFKKKATKESTQAKGGAKPGHAGHGRRKHSEEEVDKVIELSFCVILKNYRMNLKIIPKLKNTQPIWRTCYLMQ